MQKHIIWSNRDLKDSDWIEGYLEHIAMNDLDYDQYNDYAFHNWMWETNNYYLDDERANLNKNVGGRILVIADLGLWDGRKLGYKIIGSNISDILYDDCDYIEWYGDEKEIRAIASHHDGTNYYTYRVIREDRNIDNLLDAIYNRESISAQKMNYYTKSLYPYVAEIYGWR